MAETDNKKVISVVKRYDTLYSDRAVWHDHWQDIRELVRPDTGDFTYSAYKGERKTEKIYDGTAPWALNMLTSSLNSYMTSAIDRWFQVESREIPASMLDHDSLLWLEFVSDRIYEEYAKPESMFNSALSEFYLDECAFGTASIFQRWDSRRGHIVFKSCPLHNSFISENSNGLVDTMYFMHQLKGRQIEQMFPESAPSVVTSEKGQDRGFEVIHAVFPRDDRAAEKLNKTNMAFASIWVLKSPRTLLREDGFHGFPYHTSRWVKLAGEIYGRSPAMMCLPDIKMLNQMSKVIIKSAQKVVDPPLVVPDDGFVLPIKTFPGALIYKESGADNIEPLITNGQVGVGLEMMNQVREQIVRSFYVDWLLQQKNNVEMTATEVMDRREERFRMLGPVTSRQQSEMHGPMVARSYDLLSRSGSFPPPPPQLSGTQLKVGYISAAARAQRAGKVTAMRQFLEEIAGVAQTAPDAVDAVDFDKYVQEVARHRDVPRTIIRSEESVGQIRQRRMEAEQEQQQMEAAQGMAGALKDLSVADVNAAKAGQPRQ